MTGLRPRLAALAAAAVLTLTIVGVASANESGAPSRQPALAHRCAALGQAVRHEATVGTLREFGICQIERRQVTLDRLLARVAGSKVMTADHASTLTAELTAAKSGLAGLKVALDSDTTVEQLKVDIGKISTDYRVYRLIAPKMRLINATDGGNAAVVRLGTLETKLQARINAASSAGKDVSGAQADLDLMQQQVTAAHTALASIDEGQLLALTPANWNDGTAQPILAAIRTSLKTTHADLRAARTAAQDCVIALKALGA